MADDGILVELLDPLTKEPAWYHNTAPLDGRGEPITHEATPTDCGTCGAKQAVHQTTEGPVCSTWRCATCGQEWTWENKPGADNA